MLFSRRSSMPRSYRFVARLAGRSLPQVDKALRLRCTLSAADHSIVGVSALVLQLGEGPHFEQSIELLHEAGLDESGVPKYFELIASIAPVEAPMARLTLAGETAGDPCEYRIAGMMDPAQGRIALPEIVLSGA
jgi:hypothetical protein